MTGAEEEAWNFLAVCVPIVVFFAPFGSFLASHFHRQVLAALIYILDLFYVTSKLRGEVKKRNRFGGMPHKVGAPPPASPRQFLLG